MQRLPTQSTTTTDTGLELAKWLGGAAAGALLMYMLDPDRGSARRAQSAAAVRYAGSRTTGALGNVWRGAGERIGAATEGALDAVKSDGIGSTLSRVGRAAGDMLDGTVSKAKDVMGRASSTAGDLADEAISKAKSGMGQAQDSDGYAGARGAVSRAADTVSDFYDDTRKSAGRLGKRVAQEVAGDSEGAWNPTMRNTALVGGGLLALMGLMRRSPMGAVLGLAGAALLARGAANQPLRSLAGRGAAGLGLGKGLHLGMGMDQPIDFEKTVHIDAPPNEVYEQFANYENFPRFMSHVAEVRDLGRRRSHWIVKGPGGSRFEWNSVLTEQSRPNRLAWRSEPGAEIPNSGSIQFERHRGGTLVTVRMSYTPPAGAIGHAFALLLGSDPKSQMDEDLGRMKSLIERGSMPREAAQSSWVSRLLH
ncbi:SRPBCC family protein [Massilia sp. LXY-6]|uniref:SRPBCC family protein n=1 Tax=Massilia sp. LXY-6 TaxID=3379823 RepID=UPI003EE1561E